MKLVWMLGCVTMLAAAGCAVDGSTVAKGATARATRSLVDAPGDLTLTSTAVAEGATIPVDYACGGRNVSPPLTWTAGPDGTLSYALIFADESFGHYRHWAIWDIGSDTTELPEAVEPVAEPSDPAGAKQAASYVPTRIGYLGPCPPEVHSYQFTAYALDVATLPGVTTASTMAQVEAALAGHVLASGTLNIQSDGRGGP